MRRRGRFGSLHRLRRWAYFYLLLVGVWNSGVRDAAQAADVTWGNVQSDWTLNGSWVGGAAPLSDLFAHRAVFSNTTTINAQPSLSGSYSIGGLSFDDTGADWNLTGAGMLRIGGTGIALSGGGTTVISPRIQTVLNQTWNVSSGTLQLAGNIYGGAVLTLTNLGTKQISGTRNMLHGTVINAAGTLIIDSPLTALRSAALQNDSALTVNSALRSGELSGAAALTINSANELRIVSLNNGNYSGTLTAGDVTVRGVGRQTFSGNLTGVTGDLVVGRGASVVLTNTTTFNNSGNDLVLRGGSFKLDNEQGQSNSRFNNSGGVSFLGGGVFEWESNGTTTESVGGLTLGQGHARIRVITDATGNPTVLNFSSKTIVNALTVDFYGLNNSDSPANTKKLGDTGGAPRITFASGQNDGFIGGYATVDASNFAEYASATGVSAVTTVDFATASGNSASLSASATYNGGGKTIDSLKIGVSGSLNITGAGGVDTKGVLLTANHTFTIKNSGGGTGKFFSANSDHFVHVYDNSTLAIETDIAGGTNVDLVKAGPGTLILTPATANSFTGLYINQGVVRTDLSAGLISTAITRFRGGVLEVAGGATFNRTVGTAAGNVNWMEAANGLGSGGFSAVGGTLTVDLNEAGASNLTWGGTNFVQNDYALMFGSQNSDADVVWADNLALNVNNQSAYEVREIDVDGSSGSNWKTTVSGVISSVAYGGSTNGQLTDLMKTGTGTLELTGNNTYVGGTIVAEGVLLVGHTNALGDASQSGAYVHVGDRGANSSSVEARLLLSAPIVFSRDVDISAGNGARALGGIATGTAEFSGNVYLQDLVTLRSEAGAVTKFSGEINGAQDLQTSGPGTVILSGNNSYTGITTIFAGTLQLENNVLSGTVGALGRSTQPVMLGASTGSLSATMVAAVPITFNRQIITKTGTGATGTLTLGTSHTSGTSEFSGGVTLQRGTELTAALGGTARFSGGVTGSGGLTKVGAGIVVLNGANTYTGATVVNAGSLQVGGSVTGAASTTVNGGTLRIVSGGSYNGAAAVVVASAGAVVVDSGGTLSDSVTGSGGITVNGTLTGGVTVQDGGTLGGSGRITGNIAGAGLVSPGNSPGILDAAQIDPTSGADFLFQFTQVNAAPNYLDRTNPGNDVLHLTHATTPFLSSLTSANKITLDFQVSELRVGQVFTGGFFTNVPGADFYDNGTISAAMFEYLLNGTPLEISPLAWQFQVSTTSQTGANFGSGYGGSVDGRVMQVTVTHVPEPSSMLLCAAAAGGAAWRARRQRRRPKTIE